MKREFLLKCAATDAVLKLSTQGPDRWHVYFSGNGFSGKVDAYDDHWDALPKFFKEMSDSWKGWEGEKSWQSLEGDLALSASAYRTGNVILKVRLWHDDGETEWETKGAIRLEAGQLDSLYSSAVQAFQ